MLKTINVIDVMLLKSIDVKCNMVKCNVIEEQ